jgi:hypothetical protein
MQPINPPLPAAEAVTPLSGVLMYEDREAHARALNLYAHLAIEVSRDIPFEFTWWAMPMLQTPQRASAARDAVLAADLLIIAARPSVDWPPAFKMWVESWPPAQPRRLSALGALFLPTEPRHHGVSGREVYLQSVAKQLGLDFLTAPPESTPNQLKAKLDSYPTPDVPDPVTDHANFSPYCGING